jgi:hypothetical protein
VAVVVVGVGVRVAVVVVVHAKKNTMKFAWWRLDFMVLIAARLAMHCPGQAFTYL